MADTLDTDKKVKRVYGRRMGRPMHRARLDVLNDILPQRKVDEALLSEQKNLSVSKIFGWDVSRVHFEIGFGSGEHLHYIMKQFPDDVFIGAEPYINGMTSFLKECSAPPEENFRVHMDDALMVLNSLEDASVDFLYILNPDPWPKSRHRKRRIVNEANLSVYARVLKDNGIMLQTTDVDELADWMLMQSMQCKDFEWLAESFEDCKSAPNGWMATRYENKGKDAGRTQTYLSYRRLPRCI